MIVVKKLIWELSVLKACYRIDPKFHALSATWWLDKELPGWDFEIISTTLIINLASL